MAAEKTRDEQVAEAREKLAKLKAKNAAKKGADVTTADVTELIRTTFGPAGGDPLAPADDAEPVDGYTHVGTFTGSNFRMGYANGNLRVAIVIPADARTFQTLHDFAESTDGFEIKVALYAPAGVMAGATPA